MIRVLVVNEIRPISDVLTMILGVQPDMEVVGAVASFQEAQAQMNDCDVILISSRLPGGGALRFTQAVTEQGRAPKILVLGLNGGNSEILRFIEAGASGYVLKDDSADRLLEAVRAVHHGMALISPRIAGALISRIAELSQQYVKTARQPNSLELTLREQEVLTLIGQGLTNPEIAALLNIEVGTVKNHVHRILRKMNVNSRQDAAVFCQYYWTQEQSASGKSVASIETRYRFQGERQRSVES